MDEVREFCRRVLGPGAVADAVAGRAGGSSADRIGQLAEAVRLCRNAPDGFVVRAATDPEESGEPPRLLDAVAAEMAAATAHLPESRRELLALRELLGLSHTEIAQVLALSPDTVAPMLADARLRLRVIRRGSAGPDAAAGCTERERALAELARRQDHEPLSDEDHDWLFAHLAGCAACETAHAAMLEASACYRAWPIADAAA